MPPRHVQGGDGVGESADARRAAADSDRPVNAVGQPERESDTEHEAVQAIWVGTRSTIGSGFLIGTTFLVATLALFPWRESLDVLYGYWVLGWLALCVSALLAVAVSGLRATRRVTKEWQAQNPSPPHDR